LDLRLRGGANAEGGNYGFATKEVFASGVGDAKNGKAISLSSMLRAEELVESTGRQAHFGARGLREIAVILREDARVLALNKCAEEGMASLRRDLAR
jgi:hypothetical protein